jgi:Ser/Thr protein kinase RdoA (MazF antagonist)
MKSTLEIARNFALPAVATRIEPLDGGLINDSYVVHATGTDAPCALLQRINPKVFGEPKRVMVNLRTALDHIEARPDAGLRLPVLYPTRDGHDYFEDETGAYWRALEYLAGTRTLARLTTPAQAAAVGRALGRFHALLHDLSCTQLEDTLRSFHVTPRYLERFDAVMAESQTAETPELQQCLAFIAARRERAGVLEQARTGGVLHARPVHGDPKVDNFLFAAGSDEVAALIDLDTITCGLVQYDIGDCLRSACNPAGESPERLEDVRFDLDYCRAALAAYLPETRDWLTSADYEFLYDAIALIPFELGLRFLTDHVAGDRYFKTEWLGQNLHRAEVQFRLRADIERNRRAIEELIAAARH